MHSREENRAINRLTLLVCLALVWAAAIAVRLFYLQVLRHQAYLEQAERQQSEKVEIPGRRGSIFDRSGQPLAMSLPVDSVCINPIQVRDAPVTAGILGPILNLDRRQFEDRMNWALAKHRGFLWVKRKISLEESERLRSLGLDWIEFRKESKRSYPNGSLASHVVGAVDHRERGNAGIEQSLDDELRGQPGLALVVADVRRQGISSELLRKPVPGQDITLTIDERIQFVAERELKKASEANRCDSGSVVVMDPHNGEILALASYPAFDANLPVSTSKDLKKRANHAVSVPFEPGSVFKIVTLSAALETTRLRPDTIIPCGGGRIRLFGRVIHDHNAYDALSMADVLARSSNIGAIQVGLRVGEARLFEYVQRFGFGRTTGVPLPGESAGVVWDLDHWGKTSIGSVAMGHELSATTLQLAQAVSVIANGGLLVKPRLILRRQSPGKALETEPAEPLRRVLKPETAITMRQMMEGVVLHGTGKLARLEGYTAGGKTGTAQIFDPDSRRYTHSYNASFVGFSPMPDPAIVVAVTLNGASKYGGSVAAPVFREVAAAALRLLDVPKDLPDLPPDREDEPVELNDLAIADLGLPALPLPEPESQEREAAVGLWGPRVPDFYGKSMRVVLEESSAAGLPVEFSGSGVARAQAPAAGSILPYGEKVRIQFAR